MFLYVTEVGYLTDHRLRVTFNNGVTKDVDLEGELYGDLFEPLKELEFFRQAAINPDTNRVQWPNGASFAPAYLYKIGQGIEPAPTTV